MRGPVRGHDGIVGTPSGRSPPRRPPVRRRSARLRGRRTGQRSGRKPIGGGPGPGQRVYRRRRAGRPRRSGRTRPPRPRRGRGRARMSWLTCSAGLPRPRATRSQKRRRSPARSSAHWATLRTCASCRSAARDRAKRVLGMAARCRAHRHHADGTGAHLPEAQRAHGHAHQLDHVHERERRRQLGLAAVDPQGDGLVALGVERHQLGRDPGHGQVVERAVQQHHPLGQQPARQELGQRRSAPRSGPRPTGGGSKGHLVRRHPCSILHSSRAPSAVL